MVCYSLSLLSGRTICRRRTFRASECKAKLVQALPNERNDCQRRKTINRNALFTRFSCWVVPYGKVHGISDKTELVCLSV
jgi:hypothetical protein